MNSQESNAASPPSDGSEPVEHGELLEGSPQPADEDARESVNEPARVMRIGSMIRQLLEEVRSADLDDRGRERLREIYNQSIEELSGALSDDLTDELHRLASPFAEEASAGELRVAKAQLVGWLEGLFHGIQATLFAQQAAARQQLEQMRHQLVSGQQADESQPGPPGTYL